MKLLRTAGEMRQWSRSVRNAELRLGLVPTMGALHDGHLQLVRAALRDCDRVVVSIFVNPLQFGPDEDYDTYPRDLDRDRQKLERLNVDALFSPPVSTMYPEGPENAATRVRVETLSHQLCGASRPGFFDGAATVVLKLFHLTEPDAAYFGEKDWQQTRVIKQMVKDLNLPLEIETVPTVREADGLAVSSRNQYLTPAQREVAPELYETLQVARRMVLNGERNPAVVVEQMEQRLKAVSQFKLDYAEAVEAERLQPLDRLEGDVLLAAAVWLGEARLIDNVRVNVD